MSFSMLISITSQSLTGLDTHADAGLAGFAGATGTDRSSAFEQHHLGRIDRHFFFNDTAGLVRAAGLFMTLADVHAGHGHAALGSIDADHVSGLAFEGAGDNLDVIVLLNLSH